MAKLACVFPGQGSQSVGMGLDLYNSFGEARSAFDTIDKIACKSLSKLCFEGPEAELKKTINTQPTILAASLAAWACYKSQGGRAPDFVAGHSLGEITAMVAANALSLEEAVLLVQERAMLMEDCPKGAMAAVLGIGGEALEAICVKASGEIRDGLANKQGDASSLDELDHVVIVANFNTNDQLVISGAETAVAKASDLAKAAGGKVIPLPVGGAFHSPLMRRASEKFGVTLSQMLIEDPSCPVVQNFDGKPSESGQVLRDKLSQQMGSSVRWFSSVEYMIAQGVDTFVEIGPGRVLAGTIKKIDKNVKIFNVSDAQSLQATLHALEQVPAL
jgi:[acyl-carrier-protein] S-malonyltransferase